MAKVKEATPEQDMAPQDFTNPEYYINRELSWLEFNNRVLHEAFDPRTPLLERLKFLAIFSSNLDEFFMVRVSGLMEQVEAGIAQLTPEGMTPQQQLEAIVKQLRPAVTQQHQHFEKELRPKLRNYGVHLVNYVDLNQEQRAHIQKYFQEQVFPVLTPLALDPGHPFPYMSNLSLNLAVVIKDAETEVEHFARVKVPAGGILPRFVALPEALRIQEDAKPAVWMGVPLEQVVAHNLEPLFPGMQIQEVYPFRITRDADFEFAEDEADDLLLAIEQAVRKRRIGGSVVRLEINPTMPDTIRNTLIEELEIASNDVYEVNGLLCLRDLFAFLGLPLPELKDNPWVPVTPLRFAGLRDLDSDPTTVTAEDDIFSILRKQDILVHHPYHSFSTTVERFIAEAACDPSVLTIKMTLYRTSGDSPIINSLIAAAENGKQVAALVELKARFDEENNIVWARKLEKSGVHVVYGLVGLKTHTKVVLVVRREENRIRRYVHIGTGNYNPKTAKLYTDLGLLSCDEGLGADLTDLFNYLTGYSRQQSYRKLLVAPVTLRKRMEEMIRRETEHCRNGASGRIVAKMNSLVDPSIIAALYEASQAGVQIDLIVRGICCLRPGLPGVSDRIRVISIVGRLLEHSRIFYFNNNGKEEIYIGSADWMPRNLDRRVEAVTPIEDPEIAKDLQEILGIMLADNRQAWELQPDGQYVQRRPPENGLEQNSQNILTEMAQQSVAGKLHTSHTTGLNT